MFKHVNFHYIYWYIKLNKNMISSITCEPRMGNMTKTLISLFSYQELCETVNFVTVLYKHVIAYPNLLGKKGYVVVVVCINM